MRNLQCPTAALPGNPAGIEGSEGLAPPARKEDGAPMNVPDAIRRAQGWQRAVEANRPSFVSDPVRRAREGLAALGPASVALAEALAELNEAVKSNGLFLDMRTADDALMEWAQAVSGEAE